MNMPDRPTSGPPASGPHASDELLAALALDGDSAEIDPQSRAHVARCAQCTAEVAALLEIMTLAYAGRSDVFTAPPASVGEAVFREIDGAGEVDQSAPDPVVTSLTARRGRVSTWWVAAAASVALVAGVGIGAVVQSSGEPEESAAVSTVLGSTDLVSLDDSPEPRGGAEVRRSDDRVVLRVDATDLGGPAGTREVWLINTDGARMVSLGLLAGGDAGDFEFPERLLEQGYRIVDISYEPDDGDPVHSGKSLARGTIDG